MNQRTFTDIEYSKRKRKTKREQFLEAMEEIIPWKAWIELIRPFTLLVNVDVLQKALK